MFDIKVGQEVGYGKYHWGDLIHKGTSVVAKINQYGHIVLENGRVFDKQGYERRTASYSSEVRLIEIGRFRTEETALAARRDRTRLVQEIETLIGENRRFAFSDELKARLQDMVGRL
jgi:hypothetical protein